LGGSITMKTKQHASTGEFDLAWQEFFKDKPAPKDDAEDKKQQEEFHYWYNHVRKQSDTGKTPAAMYKEVYGREPPENPDEPSRMMNFGWDEDSAEDDFTEEDIMGMKRDFDRDFWPRIKQEIKDMTKKEACFTSFLLGFETMKATIDEQFKETTEQLNKLSPEEIRKLLEQHDKADTTTPQKRK